MEFVLIGQPNCGKSTIFNSVVGYKSVTSNFPGVTVSYTKGEIDIENEKIAVIDIPGTYSLQASDKAEHDAVRYILELPDNAVIINVIDASMLSRSLELTLQLMEIQRPMVVALNMMDEAERKGMEVSFEALRNILGVPVVGSVGRKGEGVSDIFREAYRAGKEVIIPNIIKGSADVEQAVREIESILNAKSFNKRHNDRFLAIKLLEKDGIVRDEMHAKLTKSDWSRIKSIISSVEKKRKTSSEFIISSYRHSTAFTVFEDTCRVADTEKPDIRTRIDNVLMHPVLGYISLIAILFIAFWSISAVSEWLEPVLDGFFSALTGFISKAVDINSILYPVIKGLVEGFGGGITVAIPFLVPFFMLLAVLEDTGYLVRIAFLTDNLMHRIGLHGMSVVPLILGYGCSVPAIMATRILKSPRDRFITAVLATFVPCSARMVVILGLVGAIFSMKAALMIYIINIIVLGMTGKLLSMALPVVSPGLLMEMPKYHMPTIKATASKTWMRLKEFIFIAWPLLMAGSVVLELITHYKIHDSINRALSPFTSGLLGLPAAVGMVLLFGIMRKELALLLLVSALGVSSIQGISTVMSPMQIYGFTVFATFYIPCLATVAALAREFGWRKAIYISCVTFLAAILLALAVRIYFLIVP